jgi:hypothetical protein
MGNQTSLAHSIFLSSFLPILILEVTPKNRWSSLSFSSCKLSLSSYSSFPLCCYSDAREVVPNFGSTDWSYSIFSAIVGTIFYFGPKLLLFCKST